MNEIYGKQSTVPAVRQVPETGLIGLLIVLAKHKRLILGVPLLASLLAAAVSLTLPNIYQAGTKILPPQQAQSGAAALLAQLGGAAGAAMSVAGIKTPNDLYIGMLKSRTIADRLITRFDLKRSYETDSMEKARRILEDKTTIGSGKDGMIVVQVEDYDRKKAPLLANAYIEELVRQTQVLAVTEAAQRRLFFEKQLGLSKDNLADAEAKLKEALDTNGVISVDSDSRAIVETVARVRAQISAKEIERNSMKAFVTTNNTDYQRVEQELNSLRGELARLQGGSGDADSSGTSASKSAGLASVKLLRDVKYHQMLYELLAKQYEVARLDEAKDAAVIQVLDPAVEPERKVKPARSLIVLGTALLTLLLAVAWAFVRETKERAMQVPQLREQWSQLRHQLRWKN